jgi:hydroxymethylpyrimidine pyrophosphatase-like HAD family hydrolase
MIKKKKNKRKTKMIYICIDFDGTIVKHDFPNIGADIGAFKWIKKAQEQGAKFILFTMRSGEHLDAAVEFCKSQGLEFYGVNVNPTQARWTSSPKAYGQLYIDDAALGTPLVYSDERPYVDWDIAGPLLMEWLEEVKG